ncbi:MAG: hypothetical protein ABI480_17040, partial [Chitinophagaceae bacterium]
MKSTYLKLGVLMLASVLLVNQADAQRPSRKRPPADPNAQSAQQQQTNKNASSGYDPYAGVPIRVDSSGIQDTMVHKSLRNDNAFEKGSLNSRTPLPYEYLRWDDALFAEKVWREL